MWQKKVANSWNELNLEVQAPPLPVLNMKIKDKLPTIFLKNKKAHIYVKTHRFDWMAYS